MVSNLIKMFLIPTPNIYMLTNIILNFKIVLIFSGIDYVKKGHIIPFQKPRHQTIYWK
jgi:hypothetical protein